MYQTRAADMETIGTAAAARIVGVSEGRIRQLANLGRIRVIPTPLGRTYRRADVERLAAERAARQENQP